MMIVLPLLVTIKGYLEEYGNKSPDIEIACPYCGRRLRRHGRYFRRVVLGTVLYRIPVYRRLCPRCRKSRFLGIARGFVAVYAGTPAHPGGVLEVTGIRADALPAPELADLRRGIPFADAKERLQLLEGLAALLND